MPKTVLLAAGKEWRGYHPRAAIERRQATADRSVDERWREAQRLAREAAGILRQFDAVRIVLFGSAARRPSFTTWSDVDLAVWGIAPHRFYAAVAAVTKLSAQVGIDLVDAAQCGPMVRRVIDREGVEL